DVGFQRTEIWADAGVLKDLGIEARRCGKRPRNDGKHAGHVSAGLFHGDAGLEAGDTFIAEIAKERLIAVPFKRKKHGRISPIEKMKALRKDSDNLMRLPIQEN